MLYISSGYLIGFASHRRPADAAPSCDASFDSTNEDVAAEDTTVPFLDWNEITTLLSRKLTTSAIDKSLRYFCKHVHIHTVFLLYKTYTAVSTVNSHACNNW